MIAYRVKNRKTGKYTYLKSKKECEKFVGITIPELRKLIKQQEIYVARQISKLKNFKKWLEEKKSARIKPA